MPRACIIAFDPAWASPTGWAVLVGGRGIGVSVIGTGVVSPPARRGKVTTDIHVARTVSLLRGLTTVLSLATPFALASEHVVVAYESPLDWLLAAARKGSKRARRPVTRNSLFGAAFPVVVLWLAVGLWRESLPDCDVRIMTADTRSARAQFDVSGWCNRCDSHGKLAEEVVSWPGYDDSVKASVGVAVAYRVQEIGYPFSVPKTDHEADALLFALVQMDSEVHSPGV